MGPGVGMNTARAQAGWNTQEDGPKTLLEPKLCSDCGNTPVWWRSGWQCRRCSDKGGSQYLSRVEVDADKVLAYFGGDEAKAEDFFKRTEGLD